MAINVTSEGEIAIQGDYLKKRVRAAGKLNENMLWAINNDYWIMLRGNQTYGGILFHRDVDYEEGVEKPKNIGYIVTKNGEIIEESLDRLNKTTNMFESVIVGQFAPCLLTARTGPSPQAQLYWWEPPREANEKREMQEQIQTLLNMYNAADTEAKKYRQEKQNVLRQLNSAEDRNKDLEQRNQELQHRLNTIVPTVEALENRLTALQTKNAIQEEAIETALKNAAEAGRFKGLTGLDLVKEVMDKIEDIQQDETMRTLGQSPEEVLSKMKQLEEQIEGGGKEAAGQTPSSSPGGEG